MPYTAKQVIALAKPGESVTLNTGQSGRVVFARPDGAPRLVLDLGGEHGTPGIATEQNVVAYRHVPIYEGKQAPIDSFIAEARASVAYEADRKAFFHREGKRILNQIAQKLGLQAGEYSIRSNMGGIAVSGEVTLHADWIYIQFSQSSLGPDFGFMWRTCKHQKDYTGGPNRWMKWEELRDLDAAVEKFNQVRHSPVA